MAKVESFTGPVTLLDISEWLSLCEESFEASTAPLTNKQKILAAGSAVAKSQDTKVLYDWWTKERKKLEGKTWNEFRDAIKDKALGRSWRMKALLDFYSTSQGSAALEDYISRFEERNDIPAFAKADPDDVKDWLRKYDTGDGSGANPAPTPSPSTAFEAGNSRTYIVTGLALPPYYQNCASFNDLNMFPSKPAALGDCTKITVWNNNDAAYPMVEGYETIFSNPSLTAANLWSHNKANFSTLTFSAGEYISSITLSFLKFTLIYDLGTEIIKTPVRSVSGMMIVSSNPANTLSIGVMSDGKATFAAPSGWRIVGFYGLYSKTQTRVNGVIAHRTVLDTMGAIYAVV